MGLGATVFHFGAFAYYMYVLYVMAESRHQSFEEVHRVYKKYSFRFLTKWTYFAQTIYLGGAVFGHILGVIGMAKVQRKVDSFGNILLTTIAGPIAFIVTGVFWVIYNIDRELVFPKFLDSLLPPWINHSLHTINAIVPIVDIYFVHHKFPSYGLATKVMTGYMGAYAVCLFGTYFSDGVWLYPFMGHLTWPQRGILGVGNLVMGLLFYSILSFFSSLVWGSHKEKAKPIKSQKKNNNAREQKSKKVA